MYTLDEGQAGDTGKGGDDAAESFISYQRHALQLQGLQVCERPQGPKTCVLDVIERANVKVLEQGKACQLLKLLVPKSLAAGGR